MRCALAALALAACGLLQTAADSPKNGQVISDYHLVQFAGGSLHVVLSSSASSPSGSTRRSSDRDRA
jgi:hypothetical protein